MKNLIIAIAIIIGASTTSNAQTAAKQDGKKMEMKDHVCTSACANGTHVYAHGEKGHTCTAACKSMGTDSGKKELKDHVCTAACKDGKHMYAHGEKGHVCTEACKKKM